jgi:Flp pilus assembly protein CpaB
VTPVLAAGGPPALFVASAGVLVILIGSVLFGAGAGWILAGARALKGGPAVGVILSAMFVGFVAGGFLGVLSFMEIKKHEAEARRGWNLKPVVVAAVDIPAGETLTFDMISQRSLPEQFVTAAAVTPAAASDIVSTHTRVALRAGDVVYWGFTCP